ncbi:MAG: hypothetical protein ACI9U2_000730 [Bradymonadia bacterium]
MTRSVWIFTCLLMCASALPLMGCSEDEVVAKQRGRGSSKKAKKKAKVAAAVVDMTRLPKKLQNANWDPLPDLARRIKYARDPFKPYIADLVVQQEPEPEVGERLSTKIQEPPAGLQLIAIISGTAVHRAMVTDANGVGHVLRPGDMVGDEVAYQVSRITRNEVLFKPIQSPTAEKKLEDVRKTLRSQEELQELMK